MSIIKQRSVISDKHSISLKKYINRKDALLRETQNIKLGDNWYEAMETTRNIQEGMSRKQKEGTKSAKIYHQIIAFLPDEADINGGKMTPELCMKYAQQYAERHYKNHEIVFVLHKEHCMADDTYRYAIHMAINRIDLETMKKLTVPSIFKAKKQRVEWIKEMDEEWNLAQVKEGQANSKIHALQPFKSEKNITTRGQSQNKGDWESYKAVLREMVGKASDRAIDFEHFIKQLDEWRIKVERKENRIYVRDKDNPQYKFNTVKLDPSYKLSELNKAFLENAKFRAIETLLKGFEIKAQAAAATKEQIKTARREYKALLDKKYKEYVQIASDTKGTQFEKFEKFRVPRLPDILRDDSEGKDILLSYKIKGEKIRDKYASNHPIIKKVNISQSSGAKSNDLNKQKVSSRGIDKPSR